METRSKKHGRKVELKQDSESVEEEVLDQELEEDQEEEE